MAQVDDSLFTGAYIVPPIYLKSPRFDGLDAAMAAKCSWPETAEHLVILVTEMNHPAANCRGISCISATLLACVPMCPTLGSHWARSCWTAIPAVVPVVLDEVLFKNTNCRICRMPTWIWEIFRFVRREMG